MSQFFTRVVDAPATGPGRGARGEPVTAALPLWRLYLLRVGYLILGAGLAAVKWPLLVNPDPQRPLMAGVVDAMLAAVSVLMLFGLRYPVAMVPILLFELGWKLIWLGAVALPAWVEGRLDAATLDVVSDFAWVVIVLVVVPWRHVASE